MRKYTLIFIAAFLLHFSGKAQDIGLSTMSNVWQASSINPAKLTDRKLIISFPGLSGSLGTDGVTFNNITRTNESGKLVIVGDQLVDELGVENNFWTSVQLETFSAAYGGDRWQVGISHSVKMDNNIMLPKTLAQFVLQGNKQFLGEEVNIAPMFKTQSYSEWALSFALKLDRVTIGVRPKLLGGISNLSSANGLASVLTTDDGGYSTNLRSDYEVRSAGLVNVSGLDNMDEDVEVNMNDATSGDFIFGKNKGFGLDIGATFQLNDAIEISGSILDIGTIKWTENADTYTSQGEHEYKGLDFVDLIGDDETDFSEVADTLSEIFEFEKSSGAYRTSLTMRTYWTINYQLNEKFSVGGLIHSRHTNGSINPTFGVNANMDLGRWWTVGAVISQGESTGFAVGANTVFRLGPVQLFFSSDNLLGMMKPLDNSFAHGRFGMNLAFGERTFE